MWSISLFKKVSFPVAQRPLLMGLSFPCILCSSTPLRPFVTRFLNSLITEGPILHTACPQSFTLFFHFIRVQLPPSPKLRPEPILSQSLHPPLQRPGLGFRALTRPEHELAVRFFLGVRVPGQQRGGGPVGQRRAQTHVVAQRLAGGGPAAVAQQRRRAGHRRAPSGAPARAPRPRPCCVPAQGRPPTRAPQQQEQQQQQP